MDTVWRYAFLCFMALSIVVAVCIGWVAAPSGPQFECLEVYSLDGGRVAAITCPGERLALESPEAVFVRCKCPP